MNIATRTPEGNPNHCPVCGAFVIIEPSRPPGDAPCPACGVLLWFAPNTTILVADGDWAKKLDKLDEPVEICTPDGKRLGFFTPAKPRVDQDELDQREIDPNTKWYTAEQVMAKLKELRNT